jgi:hypothetical protein
MDLKISKGPFGSSIEFTGASPEEVLAVLQAAWPAAELPAEEVMEEPDAKDDGVAKVGQVLTIGSPDWPRGVKRATDNSVWWPILHVSRDGSHAAWRTLGSSAPTQSSDWDRFPSSFTVNSPVTVLEVW